jgi:drug/metabolite transporter (DMT)-like permease
MSENAWIKTTKNYVNIFTLPFFFVLLYGSGFVGAKLGLPHSTPLSFLSLRFITAGLILPIIAKWFGNQLPSWREIMHISVAGSLTVCLYLPYSVLPLEIFIRSVIAQKWNYFMEVRFNLWFLA